MLNPDEKAELPYLRKEFGLDVKSVMDIVKPRMYWHSQRGGHSVAGRLRSLVKPGFHKGDELFRLKQARIRRLASTMLANNQL